MLAAGNAKVLQFDCHRREHFSRVDPILSESSQPNRVSDFLQYFVRSMQALCADF